MEQKYRIKINEGWGFRFTGKLNFIRRALIRLVGWKIEVLD